MTTAAAEFVVRIGSQMGKVFAAVGEGRALPQRKVLIDRPRPVPWRCQDA